MTNESDALIARLLNPRHQAYTTRERAEMVETMREAADRIAALEAEVERLRERERLLIAKIADPETGLYRERADLQDAAIAATERAQAAEQALRALWALWNDKEWLQRRYDYERGHLSYANQLNEVERPIRAALAALQGEP